MTGEGLRAFVALPLPPAVKSRLVEVQGELRRLLPAGALRYTRPEQFHLTLAFLGEVAGWQAEAVKDLLARTAAGSSPFELATAALGAFPSALRPSVLWLGVAGDMPELHALQEKLMAGLAGLDLAGSAGEFLPHLTLARVAGPSAALRREIAGASSLAAAGEAPRWTADRVQLVRSRLEQGGARYEVLAERALAGRAA